LNKKKESKESTTAATPELFDTSLTDGKNEEERNRADVK